MAARSDSQPDCSPREARDARFCTTDWNEVVAARDGDTARGQAALAALCEGYWYPLYAYVRGCGFPAADAEDITQAFFARALESELVAGADPGRGRFRWYLLTALQNFLRNQIARSQALKRGGACSVVSWDALEAEERFLAEPSEGGAPDEMFDRRWARTTMSRAFQRLTEEFAKSGRGGLFEHLKGCLAGGGAVESYQELASRLGISVSAVKVTVHRLRRRYRDLLRAEVARTVMSPEEVDIEYRHLMELIAR